MASPIDVLYIRAMRTQPCILGTVGRHTTHRGGMRSGRGGCGYFKKIGAVHNKFTKCWEVGDSINHQINTRVKQLEVGIDTSAGNFPGARYIFYPTMGHLHVRSGRSSTRVHGLQVGGHKF